MVGNKHEMIFEICANKEVLDLGCVNLMNNFTPEKLRQTLHYKLRKHVKKVVGIDLEEEGVKVFNEMGCECYVSFAEDVEQLNLGKFDVVLLGDIIEHIPDPSTFLISLRGSLKDDGIIVCVTPNALAYSNALFIALNKEITRKQHVAWYCKITLENLFKLSGYTLVEMNFCNYAKTGSNVIRKIMDSFVSKINNELSPHLFGVFKLSKSFDKKGLQKKRLFQ